ncbi:hypothetical protein [Alkalihalobacillus pseudalcaliphilus]|uniref:hypothetical protein n=1 Tax=Alkalihalobacillus pseudalcaliphilus TaxID=79884 RepID=UPI00064DE561|nr:hypothetical protein [Alkalihalobacillus pseudalcaliphilus]KMK76849.1 hypothetical protein AB990_08100 [Alkalihalobacillus pseudalcaliphilus]
MMEWSAPGRWLAWMGFILFIVALLIRFEMIHFIELENKMSTQVLVIGVALLLLSFVFRKRT